MYGTVAVMRLKPGAEAKLKELLETFNDLEIPGFLFEYLYRLDADPNAYVMVAAFESKEAYLANANSPEQHARYLQYRDLLEADPQWHDGEIAYP
jgi:quinol monooxygenase YgiN